MYFNDITNILSTDFTDTLTWYLIKDVKTSNNLLLRSTYLFSLPYNGSIGSLPLISISDRHKYINITKSGEVIGLGSIHITTKSIFYEPICSEYDFRISRAGYNLDETKGLYHKQTNIILFKNDIYECKLTKDFFFINTNLFEDISKEVNRDKKINKLIK
jgi:hypothetical protein